MFYHFISFFEAALSSFTFMDVDYNSSARGWQ